jgi:hypothetical protein
LEARRTTAVVCGAAALAIAGCAGDKKQDENEPEGNFEVDVVEATFPSKQKLAKRSDLVITVRNTGAQTIPNIAVTIRGLTRRKDDPDLADPERPIFVINGQPKEIGGVPEAKDAAPEGCETAYLDTWACGRLAPGKSKTFKWSVTAVQAGPFDISYRVAAGLDGKARAVAAGGTAPTGKFSGNISDEAPDSRVADDGKTIVEGTR